MAKSWQRILLLGIAALLLSLSAWAQTSTTGIIEGRVRDQAGNPIADATVTGVAGRAPAATVTDDQGRYTLANLPPGTYTVRAEAPGKASVVLDTVVVSINTRTRVDVTLVAGQTETVTVTAEAPMIDTKSVTTGGNFKVDNFIDQLPIGRNLAATLTLAPGVESGGGTGTGNYSMSGSTGLENSYIVDGVNITNTGYGGIGAYNVNYGSLGTGVTYDFLEEVQVKTGGIDVEFGQATGGVVNTVVRTGSNDLSGSATIYAGAPINQYQQTDLFVGAVNKEKGDWGDNAQYDLGLSVGGPLVKDKLFYFVAYNPVVGKNSATIQDIPLPSNISAGNPATVRFDPTPNYPAAVAGIQTRERTSNNYAAKLTWYTNPNHRLELTAFGDPSTGDMGAQRFSLRNIDYAQGGGLSEIDYGGNNYAIKYDGVFTPTLFMQAQIGRHDAKFEETSALNKSRYQDDRQLRCFLSPNFCATGQSRDNAAVWANGGVGFISNQKDVNNMFKAVVTWVAGNNELKGGVSYDQIEYTDRQDYTGSDIPVRFGVDTDVVPDGIQSAEALGTPCVNGPPGTNPTDCYVLLDTRGGVVANLRQTTSGAPQFRTTRGRYSPNPGPTETNDFAIFIQDTFTFAQRWTLKAGLRASQQEIAGEGNYTLQYYLDDGSRTSTDLRTTTSPTPTTYKFDWAYAPRIGLTWDMKGDGRSKSYVNAARYYERIPNDLAIRALSNEAGFGTVTYTDWDLINGQPLGQSNLGSFRGGQTDIAPGTKLPYVDELVLGWQQELGRDVSVELRGIYREQGRSLEDVQFNSVEATENYYAAYYFGYVMGMPLDTEPFPYDPAETMGPFWNPAITVPGVPFGHYVLANPGENTSAGFPSADRKYYALEGILNKRFGDHWLFYGNMRFSRLRGNYEGLYRNDNGQSDPNISSLFDFPNSPILEGQLQAGPLNTDRPYSMKLYGSYVWDNGFALGSALNVAAGTPRTSLLAHPNGFYQNAGEVPGANPIYYWYSSTGCTAGTLCLTTGSPDDFFSDTGAAGVTPPTAFGSWSFPHLYDYEKVGRAANGRTSTETTIDLSLSWSKQFNRWATFGVGATVFNLLNSRETTFFDDNIERQAGVTNPDYLKPAATALGPNAFQNPRNLRVYAKWSF